MYFHDVTLLSHRAASSYAPLDHRSQKTKKYLYNMCTMLDQRRRRRANVVHMLYKYFVFAGYRRSHSLVQCC